MLNVWKVKHVREWPLLAHEWLCVLTPSQSQFLIQHSLLMDSLLTVFVSVSRITAIHRLQLAHAIGCMRMLSDCAQVNIVRIRWPIRVDDYPSIQ